MATIDSLPSHFGRSTVISGDHQRIATMLRELGDICSSLPTDASEPRGDIELQRLISELRVELARHFAAEESDDYFGAISRERPSLVIRIAELRADHTRTLEAFAELATIVADQPHQSEVSVAAMHLIETLRAHEQEESRLLGEFLTHSEA